MNIKLYALALTLFFFTAMNANAQTKIKRFCEISFYPGNEFLLIDYGKINKIEPFKDGTFTKKLNLIKRINNLIKGLNYMTDLGWKFESNISHGTSDVTRILFSREFGLDELNDTSSELNSSELRSNY